MANSLFRWEYRPSGKNGLPVDSRRAEIVEAALASASRFNRLCSTPESIAAIRLMTVFRGYFPLCPAFFANHGVSMRFARVSTLPVGTYSSTEAIR